MLVGVEQDEDDGDIRVLQFFIAGIGWYRIEALFSWQGVG